MRIGKGNSKGMGGMTKGNSIMVNNLVRQKAFKDPNKIFVGNLNFTTTTDDLKNLCKQYGEVAHVKLVKNHYTGNSKVSIGEMVSTSQLNLSYCTICVDIFSAGVRFCAVLQPH